MCLSLSSRLSITASPTAPRFLPEINLRTPVLFKLIRRADRRAAFLFSSTFFNGLQVLRFSRRYRFALRGFSLGCFFFFLNLSRVTTRFRCCCYFLLPLLLQHFWPCSSCLSIALSCVAEPLCRSLCSLLRTFAFLPCLSPISSSFALSLVHIGLFTLSRLAQLVPAFIPSFGPFCCRPRPFLSHRVLSSTRDRIIIRHHTNHLRLPTIPPPRTQHQPLHR